MAFKTSSVCEYIVMYLDRSKAGFGLRELLVNVRCQKADPLPTAVMTRWVPTSQ
jgi:hypothetical protein